MEWGWLGIAAMVFGGILMLGVLPGLGSLVLLVCGVGPYLVRFAWRKEWGYGAIALGAEAVAVYVLATKMLALTHSDISDVKFAAAFSLPIGAFLLLLSIINPLDL